MKRIVFLCLLVVLITSCKKRPLNYRNKYLGDWEFSITEKNSSGNTIKSYTEKGSIVYGKEEYTIKIIMPTAYLSHDYQLIKHSKKISDGPRQPGATTKYDTEGSFSSKSSLSFQSQVSYPGGYVNYEVTGIKTSK